MLIPVAGFKQPVKGKKKSSKKKKRKRDRSKTPSRKKKKKSSNKQKRKRGLSSNEDLNDKLSNIINDIADIRNSF